MEIISAVVPVNCDRRTNSSPSSTLVPHPLKLSGWPAPSTAVPVLPMIE